MSGCRTAITLGVALGVLACGSSSRAGMLSGVARVFYGTTEANDLETKVNDQDYSVSWQQPITPLLKFGLFYRYNLDKTEPENLPDFERTTSEPSAELAYGRQNVSARLFYSDRRSRGTLDESDLDTTALIGQVDWRPRLGPQWVLRYQDRSNVPAAVSVFGRDIDTRTTDIESYYGRRLWNVRYAYRRTDIDNNDTDLEFDENLHEVRFTYNDRFWDDRATFSADAFVRRVDQEESIPLGTTVFEPVPPRQGLFEVDTTPDFGPLAPSPGLIDGDLVAPVVPPIDIGGASTFRNIGLDLGVTRPISRLEITVDRNSFPGIVWEVYISPDNFNWQLVAGVTSTFDAALLRYTLDFPEATERFVKAVNVSSNPIANVLVTEMRGFRERESIGRTDSEATTYRLNLSSTLRPNDRVTALFGLLFRNDEDLAQDRISRDIEDVAYNARISVILNPELVLSLGYRYNFFEENLEPVLQRTERTFDLGLDWNPMSAVYTSFSAFSREETERGETIRETDALGIRNLLDLYEELRLISTLHLSETDDPFAGFEQTTVRWEETLEGRPTSRWVLGGGFSLTWFDTRGIESIDKRDQVSLYTTWQPVPYLFFRADGNYAKDDNQENLVQRYSGSWTPGPKLALSLYYQNNESPDVRETRNSGTALNYRLNRWLMLMASLTRSRTTTVGQPTNDVNSGRVGFTFVF